MKIIKDISQFLALAVTVTILVGHLNSTYAKKEDVQRNSEDIAKLKRKSRSNGSILCGIAIDLKLPTARKECNTIIIE